MGLDQGIYFVIGFFASLLLFMTAIYLVCIYIPKRNFKRVLDGKSFAMATPMETDTKRTVYILKVQKLAPNEKQAEDLRSYFIADTCTEKHRKMIEATLRHIGKPLTKEDLDKVKKEEVPPGNDNKGARKNLGGGAAGAGAGVGAAAGVAGAAGGVAVVGASAAAASSAKKSEPDVSSSPEPKGKKGKKGKKKKLDLEKGEQNHTTNPNNETTNNLVDDTPAAAAEGNLVDDQKKGKKGKKGKKKKPKKKEEQEDGIQIEDV